MTIKKSLMGTLTMAALAVLSVQPADAAQAYLVTISTPTAPVPGTVGSIDFFLNPANTTSLPVTAQIQNFTGGTLGPAPTSNNPSGCFATPTMTCGNVTGVLPTVTLINSNSINEYLQQFTYGTMASFTLVLSGPAIDTPNPADPGTLFCLSLYSDIPGTIQIPVPNAMGCNGSVNINPDGSFTVIPSGGLATVTFTPTVVSVANAYQIGYAANLNIGDSVVNLSNSGTQGGSFNAGTSGNICVNVYAFDPQEEEVACCACLVTPNGLNSLSAQQDLISNTLTPARPTSITVTLVASQPGTDTTGAFTICNPASVTMAGAAMPYIPTGTGSLAAGMTVWGTTLEPASTPGTYNAVPVPFLNGGLSSSQLAGLTSLCNFTQANGTGFGICKSCRLGALGGAKK